MIILAVVLVTAILLIDGRVPKKYCDMYLRVEWGRASSLRISDDNVPHRPSQEEVDQLRTAIRVCKPFTSRFDLVDILSDDEVYGSISLITLAVELDDPELLAKLVAKGHPINGLPNWADITTLQFAAYRQASQSFYWLLESGVDPNAQDTDGMTALMYVASQPQDRLESIRALVEAGVDVNVASQKGWSPLAVAVRSGRFDNAAVLIEAGADVESAKKFLLELSENTPSEAAAIEIRERANLFEDYVRGRARQ